MSLKNKTVLIVDDDEDILKLLKKVLTTAGFNVLAEKTPEDGRRVLNNEAPHIIISDLHMDPEDGFSFIQSIRAQPQYSKIPILVLSALNDFGSVKKAIALGISDYIIKPLQGPMLLRKMRKALHNNDFIKWDPPKNAPINVTINFDVEIISVGETGYEISAPIKIGPLKDIKIDCEEFKTLGMDQLHQKTSKAPAIPRSAGRFNNDVTFVGVNNTTSTKFMQALKKRNNE